jgi:hypothetical protein
MIARRPADRGQAVEGELSQNLPAARQNRLSKLRRRNNSAAASSSSFSADELVPVGDKAVIAVMNDVQRA